MYWLIGPQVKPATAATNIAMTKLSETTTAGSEDECNGQTPTSQDDKLAVTQPSSKLAVARVKSCKPRLRVGVVCRRCRRIVTSLSRHERRVHHVLRKTLVCDSCCAQFTSRLDLLRHSRHMHADNVSSSSKCQRRHCQRVFSDSMRRQRHYQLHRATVKPTALASHN